MSQRILLGTGSRWYPVARTPIVRLVLMRRLGQVPLEDRANFIFRHGDCRWKYERGVPVASFDQIAADIWAKEGGTCDPMPANWDRYKNQAGPIRNYEMVQKTLAEMAQGAAAECIGFPWFMNNQRSTGTIGCMNLAHSAGIPTKRIRTDGREEPYTGKANAAMPSLWDDEKGTDDLAPL